MTHLLGQSSMFLNGLCKLIINFTERVDYFHLLLICSNLRSCELYCERIEEQCSAYSFDHDLNLCHLGKVHPRNVCKAGKGQSSLYNVRKSIYEAETVNEFFIFPDFSSGEHYSPRVILII